MMAFQFSALTSYPRVPSKHPKASARLRRASAIIAESLRAKANSTHVDKVEPVVIVAGSAHGLMRQMPSCVRPDAPILIGAVVSHPGRWDRCEPAEVCAWVVAEITYFDNMWPGFIAAVILHTDEGYPHLHFLVHDEGWRVVHLDPGAFARETARELLLSSGLEKSEISKKLLDAVRSAAMTKFQDHHYANVSASFGLNRKSSSPGTRIEHELAVQRKLARLVDDPVDEVAATKNKAALRALLASTPIVLKKREGGKQAAVLEFIGFDLAGAMTAPKSERKRTVRGRSKAALRELLLRIVRLAGLGWPTFLRRCEAQNIVVIPFAPGGVMKGVSFRYGPRTFSGSQLGDDLSWPSLRQKIDYDPTRSQDIAATMAALKAADESSQGLIVIIRPTFNSGAERAKPWKLSLAPTPEWPEAEMENHVAVRRRPKGRPVLEDHGSFLRIISPNQDVLRMSLQRAKSLGWHSVTAVLGTSLRGSLEPVLTRLAAKENLEIQIVTRMVVSATLSVGASDSEPLGDADESVPRRRPRA